MDKKGQRGMTLIESLIAIMVLSVFSIVIFSTFKYSLDANNTSDLITHIEEVKNAVFEQYQANPSIENLEPIMPTGSTKLNEDQYQVFYDKNYEPTMTEDDATVKMLFLRGVGTEDREGFLITSKKTTLEVRVYTKQEVAGVMQWELFATTVSDGSSKINAFQFTDDKGESATASLEVQGINTTVSHGGQTGSTIIVSNIRSGTPLFEIMDDITETPDEGAVIASRKVEYYNESLMDWEEVTSVSIFLTSYQKIRITYEIDEEFGLNLLVPEYLSTDSKETNATIIDVPFVKNGTSYEDLSIDSLTAIFNKSQYSSIFKSNVGGININYKDIIWTNISDVNDVITYEDLESGVSLFKDGALDEERFKGKTYIASIEGNPLDRHTIKFSVQDIDLSLVKGGSEILTYIDYAATGDSLYEASIAKLIFNSDEGIMSLYSVPDFSLASVGQYNSSFTTIITDITSRLESGSITITGDEYIGLIYQEPTVELELELQKNGIPTSDKLVIKVGIGEKLTSTTLTNALVEQTATSVDVFNMFEGYSFEGAFINGKNYLNEVIDSSLAGEKIELRYARAQKAMDIEINVDARHLSEYFTASSVTDMELVNRNGGIEVKFSGEKTTIQNTPLLQTDAYTYYSDDIIYSIEGSKFESDTSNFKNDILSKYNAGSYDGINISITVQYNYLDVYTAYSKNNHSFEIDGVEISSSALYENFASKSNASFTVSGVDNTFGLEEITGIDTIYSNTVTSTKTDIEIPSSDKSNIIVEEATVLLDVSLIATQADQSDWGGINSLETGRQDLQIGLVERGSTGVFDFVYYEEGNPVNLMTPDSESTGLSLGNIDNLEKLTIIVYRSDNANSLSSLNNYYGVWTPGIKSGTQERTDTAATGGIAIDDLYQTKNVYTQIDEYDGSINIDKVEVVMATTVSSYGQDIEGQINPLTPKTAKSFGALIPGVTGNRLLYSAEDLPSGIVEYTEPSGAKVDYHVTGDFFGDTGEELTTWTKEVEVSGDDGIEFPTLVGGIEFED